MSNLIPFESVSVPANLSKMSELFGELNNDLMVSGGGGFPTVSIKGKVFTLKRGDEKTLITRPESDEPAASLEVVILKAGPVAKVYYKGSFVEGSDAKPECYSNDGVKPSINAQSPQCSTCAACPHNAWGSHVSAEGKKNKACSDSKRLAIAPAGQINDPMLLRVPAGSIKSLSAFAQQLAKRGVHYQGVVTKIGFDYSVAHPALTFKPVGFINDDATLVEIKEAMDSDVVGRITGSIEDLFVQDKDDEFETPAPKAEKPAPAKKTAPAPKPAVEDEEDPKPKVKVAVESAPVAEKKAAPVAKPKVMEISEDLDEAMGDLDFDD